MGGFSSLNERMERNIEDGEWIYKIEIRKEGEMNKYDIIMMRLG